MNADRSPSSHSTRPTLFLDVMLGKLTTYLRMCGYDAASARDRGIEDDDEILKQSQEEDRTLITRDEQLSERAENGVLLTSLDPTDQLRELDARGFDLSLSDPARCSSCNGTLVPERGKSPDHAPDGKRIWRCEDCGKRFWKGSHWESVERTLSDLKR
ncbi:Mut7-C RNAse domain-containing protein [Haladaptatus pallidirubidus]|uniref:Mut7-C RNAse domain-containing protein n=1 Tax=Haladaptatus pallidirubidus TaxID=1008152 RepID=A0AAV3UBT8_9EURY|nr:Mut7-C RNAse domain-containing protein [Haladaptatus pallidirubidus]